MDMYSFIQSLVDASQSSYIVAAINYLILFITIFRIIISTITD